MCGLFQLFLLGVWRFTERSNYKSNTKYAAKVQNYFDARNIFMSFRKKKYLDVFVMQAVTGS